MSMANLSILRTYSNGLSFKDAIQLCKEKGKSLATNLEMDAILQDDAKRREFSSAFRCWTGTVIIRADKGKPFGTQVKGSNGLTYKVPKAYQKLVDCGIILQSPNISFNGDEILGKPLKIIKELPNNDGWHEVDKETGIPFGKEVSRDSPSARYLYSYSSQGVRPVSRDGDFVDDGRRDVIAVSRADYRFGVVASEGKQAKQKKHKCTCKYCERKFED